MKACKRCPIYDHTTNRCYNDARTVLIDGIERPLGCGCYMPVKAKLSDAECWGAALGMNQW